MNGFENFFTSHVFADGDVFHFWGDDALLGIPFLGDWVVCGCAEWLAF